MSQYQDKGGQVTKSFKVILVGGPGVGKSTLLVRYISNSFNPQQATVGLDYRSKKIPHKGDLFNLQLWDSAGQERYRTIVFNYFKLSKAGCVVFNITKQDSLQQTKYWLRQLNIHCGQIITVLVGTKSDLLLQQFQTEEVVQEYRKRLMIKINQIENEFNCKFFEVSAKTGQGIDKLFNHVFNQLIKQYNDSIEVPSTTTETNKQKEKGKQFKLGQPKPTEISIETGPKKKQCC